MKTYGNVFFEEKKEKKVLSEDVRVERVFVT